MSYAIKSTSPCFETIKAENGEIQHLHYHQERFDKTRKELYGSTHTISLTEILTPPKMFTCRVRVEYAHEIEKIEYIPYIPRKIQTFKVIDATIDYAFKYCDREGINKHLCTDVDDVIFTCKGELKDTSIANLALLIEGQWKTPCYPLLEGTTRARLLASGVLKAELLTRESLPKAEKFAIMNALIGFKIIENVCIKE